MIKLMSMVKTWLIYISSLIAGLYSQVALAQSSGYKFPDTIVVKMQHRVGNPQVPRIKGTWCGLCIAGIPALKTLFRKNKAHLSLISVAYDNDIDKVRTFVKKNNLDWMHTFAQMKQKGKGTLIEELQVDAYPTYILLDKNLNILARGISEKALTEIEEILNKNN
jgi:hypothetical protein